MRKIQILDSLNQGTESRTSKEVRRRKSRRGHRELKGLEWGLNYGIKTIKLEGQGVSELK